VTKVVVSGSQLKLSCSPNDEIIQRYSNETINLKCAWYYEQTEGESVILKNDTKYTIVNENLNSKLNIFNVNNLNSNGVYNCSFSLNDEKIFTKVFILKDNAISKFSLHLCSIKEIVNLILFS
jgi:hypothetical protein